MIKLNAQQLRISQPTAKDLAKIKRNPITIIIDNILDTYNIGAIFRLADAVAAEKIYLCGKTETPPDPRVQKASVGTWAWVPWQYASSAAEAIAKIKNQPRLNRGQKSKIKIIAIEQHPESIPYTKIEYTFPIALIVGHETSGVSKEALELSDFIAEIPMFGVNKSLNVMVSLAIVMFQAMSKNP